MAEPFSLSGNIDDRRAPDGGTSPDMRPEWNNVPASLQAVAVALGNYLWGTPMIPEAPDSPLSDALGKRDMRVAPNVHALSPLDRAIDAARDEVSMFVPGRKSPGDVPFLQQQFSAGSPLVNSLFSGPVGRLGKGK